MVSCRQFWCQSGRRSERVHGIQACHLLVKYNMFNIFAFIAYSFWQSTFYVYILISDFPKYCISTNAMVLGGVGVHTYYIEIFKLLWNLESFLANFVVKIRKKKIPRPQPIVLCNNFCVNLNFDIRSNGFF